MILKSHPRHLNQIGGYVDLLIDEKDKDPDFIKFQDLLEKPLEYNVTSPKPLTIGYSNNVQVDPKHSVLRNKNRIKTWAFPRMVSSLYHEIRKDGANGNEAANQVLNKIWHNFNGTTEEEQHRMSAILGGLGNFSSRPLQSRYLTTDYDHNWPTYFSGVLHQHHRNNPESTKNINEIINSTKALPDRIKGYLNSTLNDVYQYIINKRKQK